MMRANNVLVGEVCGAVKGIIGRDCRTTLAFWQEQMTSIGSTWRDMSSEDKGRCGELMALRREDAWRLLHELQEQLAFLIRELRAHMLHVDTERPRNLLATQPLQGQQMSTLCAMLTARAESQQHTYDYLHRISVVPEPLPDAQMSKLVELPFVPSRPPRTGAVPAWLRTLCANRLDFESCALVRIGPRVAFELRDAA